MRFSSWAPFAAFFCASFVAASASAKDGPYVHIELGAIFENASYRRVDDPLRGFVQPQPPPAHVDRTETAIGAGAPLRIDFGGWLGEEVVLAASAQVAYVDFVSTANSFGVNGSFSWAAGLSTIWYPRSSPALHARLGCAFQKMAFASSGSDVGAYDNTYDSETLSGLDCHAGGGWDFVRHPSFRLGPSLRFDASRLRNDRSNGSSTYTAASLSIALGLTFF